MEKKLKILILGATGCGKSSVANYLAEKSETVDKTYKPTVGCRILEFEKNVSHGRAPLGEPWLIQLWDLSGDTKYEGCWTAIKHETNGIMILINGDQRQNDEEFLGWIKTFPHKMNIAPNYCLGLSHHPSGKFENNESKTFMKFGLNIYHTTVEMGSSLIIGPFERFIITLVDKFYSDLEEADMQQEQNLQGDEYTE